MILESLFPIVMEPPFSFLGPAIPATHVVEAAMSRKTFSPVPSLEWVNAYGEILSWRNMHMVLGAHWSLMPAALVIVGTWKPTTSELALVFLSWLALASTMLTMNHRYFAHCAFSGFCELSRLSLASVASGLELGPKENGFSGRARRGDCP